jgi:ribosomal protein L20A (L18A)
VRPRVVMAALLAFHARLRAALATVVARIRRIRVSPPTRPRIVLAAALACLALGNLTLASAAPMTPPARPEPAEEAGEPTVEATPMAEPAEQPAPSPEPLVSVEVEGFFAWAMRDRVRGEVLQSTNARETSSTESMIKAWIVADYLRRTRNPSRQDLRDASRAIRESHNGATERLYQIGGRDRVVRRMIDICELRDTSIPDPGWWSRTEMSAVDAVRLGECIGNGTAAGPEWTDWLLEEMRQVRGSTALEDQRANFEGGRWGIIDGLPEPFAEQVSIKNGWTRIGRDNSWHISCLGITEQWVLAVMMRYPARYSLDYGAERCAEVARQLIGDRFGSAPLASPE